MHALHSSPSASSARMAAASTFPRASSSCWYIRFAAGHCTSASSSWYSFFAAGRLCCLPFSPPSCLCASSLINGFPCSNLVEADEVHLHKEPNSFSSFPTPPPCPTCHLLFADGKYWQVLLSMDFTDARHWRLRRYFVFICFPGSQARPLEQF